MVLQQKLSGFSSGLTCVPNAVQLFRELKNETNGDCGGGGDWRRWKWWWWVCGGGGGVVVVVEALMVVM